MAQLTSSQTAPPVALRSPIRGLACGQGLGTKATGQSEGGRDRQEQLVGELNGILDWIAELDEVDTGAVEPLASVTGHGLPRRSDEVTDGNRVDEVLANVPETAGGFFVVPKVVE